MRAWYVVASETTPTQAAAQHAERAETLGCTLVVGDPTGSVSTFPSVVVTSTVAEPVVFADTAGQVTSTQVAAAKSAAESAEATRAAQVEASGTALESAVGTLAAGLSQGATDTATLAGMSTDLAPIVRRMLQQEMAMAKGVAHQLVVLGLMKPTQLPPGV